MSWNRILPLGKTLFDTVDQPMSFVLKFVNIHLFLSRWIILWIKLLCPENPANIACDIRKKMDSCFDLIRSHQQWSSQQKIELVTTECIAETLHFFCHDNSIHNMIPLFKKVRRFPWGCVSPILLERRNYGVDPVLCKCMDVPTRHQINWLLNYHE